MGGPAVRLLISVLSPLANWHPSAFWHLKPGFWPLPSGFWLAQRNSGILYDMSDIFISYASEDRPYAERLAHALEGQGLSVWWDRDIPAGKEYAGVIDEAIKDTRCMVVLWSGISRRKDWVLEEAEDGKNRGILVPVLIEKVRLPRGFRRIQALDLIGWDGSPTAPAFQKLVADTNSLLEQPSKELERGERGGETGPIPAKGTLLQNRKKKRLRSIILAVSTVAVVVLAFIAWRQTQLDKAGQREMTRSDSLAAIGHAMVAPAPTFPPVDPELLEGFCIRGSHVPPARVSGNISESDSCHANIEDDGYFEGWRVRVASSTTITFAVSSVFDSWLELVRIDNLDDPINSVVALAEDDNSAGNLQARLSAELEPNTEYLIVVSGYNDVAQGQYVLDMN